MKLTPPAIAREYGVKHSTVIGWIRSGELRAIDVSRPGSRRPRYRVDARDLAAFDERRAVGKPTERRPPRKQTRLVEYV